MDKALFRAYVKELARETVQEEVKKLLPKLLEEAVAEIKSVQQSTASASEPKKKMSRSQLMEMMGLEQFGDTFVASTKNMNTPIMAPPPGLTEDNPAVQAVNKDYSAVMKAMGLTK
jgi:hypothetical protein